MTDSFNELLTRLQSSLSTVAGAGTDPTTGDDSLPQVEVTTTAHDEQIIVTMSNHEFTALKIDARAMRLTNDELSDHLLTALNAALQAYAEKMAAALQDPENATELAALQTELRDIQTQSVSAMQTYTSELFNALDQARRLQP